jgi:hypothetical protein
MDKHNTFLKKVQRRRERRHGDRDDDERRDRGESEREAVPQLDLRACLRDGDEEEDDDER